VELDWNVPETVTKKESGPPPNRHGKLDTRPAPTGRRFGRKMQRREFVKARRVTPEALASGEVEARLRRRLEPRMTPPRTSYIDLVEYLVSRGWTAKHSEARDWLLRGKVNVNGEVISYPHFPLKDLEFDNAGRPRIMVEGQPDPREVK
jgi:hypothetical protein